MIIDTEFVPWCKQWPYEWSSRLCIKFKQLRKRIYWKKILGFNEIRTHDLRDTL